MISSEYGWTDDEILNLRMGRINQIRDVILERRKENRNQDLMVEENVTIFLAQSIHGAQGNTRGVKQASKFSLRPREAKKISNRDVTRITGGNSEPAFTQEDIAAEVARLREKNK